MFRSAATKFAHNSTLPGLSGGSVKPLQDMIIAEKAVLQSLQKLSSDVLKSNECLRSWGSGEGDDLRDVLSSSTTLLAHLAAALAQLASHEQTIRNYMKNVRTREENLDELKRRKRNVASKAEAADKKLSRMSPEHKSLQQQTELLNSLREQMRNMDWEILNEEARLCDFKRSSTKNWMMLKFGGLLECAEKATIVGEMGKLVIEEIPLSVTRPGESRTFYTGHEKTEKLVIEAQRCISEVVFDPQPVAEALHMSRPLTSPQQPSTPEASASTYPERPFAPPQMEGLPSTDSGFIGHGNRNSYGGFTPAIENNPAFGIDRTGPRTDLGGNQPDPWNAGQGNVDEFGYADRQAGMGYMTMPVIDGSSRISDNNLHTGPAMSPSEGSFVGSSLPQSPILPESSRFQGPSVGGHFSTFPVRKASLPGQDIGPYNSSRINRVPAPTAPQQSAEFQSLGNVPATSSSFSAEVASALGFSSGGGSQQPPDAHGSPLAMERGPVGAPPRISMDDPAPTYESHYSSPSVTLTSSGLPRGAAAPTERNIWDNVQGHPMGYGNEPPSSGVDVNPGSGLPVSASHQFSQYPPGSQLEGLTEVPDNEETELPYASPPPQSSQLPLSANEGIERRAHFGASDDVEVSGQAPNNGSPMIIQSAPPQQERIPSPKMDEHALSAAAASEVAREMDALTFSPPVLPTNRTPSPLLPPAPLFAQPINTSPYPSGAASLTPRSEGMFRSSRTDIRNSPDALMSPSTEASVSPQNAIQQHPAINLQGPSPAQSYSSSSYTTPPEYPASSSLRSGSPASTGPFTPGSGKITAAAFKRVQIRSPSSEMPSRPLPDVSPLAVKKKGGLPSSPYPQQAVEEGSESNPRQMRDISPSPLPVSNYQSPTGPPPPNYQEQYSTEQEQHTRQSVDSAQHAQDHYDFIASYGDSALDTPNRQGNSQADSLNGGGSPGYAQGKFSTNLEDERLR